jgi:glutathione S-transferase
MATTSKRFATRRHERERRAGLADKLIANHFFGERIMSYSTITLFHSPQSRSSSSLVLLEELGAPYELHLLNMQDGEQRRSAYLAINPMGKVPAIRHRGVLVTEQVAIFIYLADLFPEAKLAPRTIDPVRGAYLRWLAFYGSCYEPALVDRLMKHEPAPPRTSPYGDFDTMFATLANQLADAPFLLGETFSAADILWTAGLQWGRLTGLLPADPQVDAYMQRVLSRDSFKRVDEMDAEWAEAHATAIGARKAG